MTKKLILPTCLFLMTLLMAGSLIQPMMAQDAGLEITGTVLASGTQEPLEQAAISVSATGSTVITDAEGKFTLNVPDRNAEIIINLPGYERRVIYLNGLTEVTIILVEEQFDNLDDPYIDPLGTRVVKEATYAVHALTQEDVRYTSSTTFDGALQGKVPGMNVIEHSGMPGHRSLMNIRGYNSLFANSEPLVFIDGMIHSYSYAMDGLMDGFTLNPLDVVDMDDISNITVMKDGNSYLGSAATNGVIYINTEQKSEASTIIKFAAYGGITLTPKYQELLNPSQFNTYFQDVLSSEGYSSDQINSMYPWLNGGESAEGYYKYNNETDWQEEIYSPAAVSKFHFFLKGGDDIATYNVSTGYLSQNGILNNSNYNRFNLRINAEDALTSLIRDGAREVLAAALEAEITEHIERFRGVVDEHGKRRVVRNGYLPEREIYTGAGKLAIKQPRARIRDEDEGEGHLRFRSKLIPPYLRKAKDIEDLIPWLYLRGISTNDMEGALSALLGVDAGGLSPSTITRCKKVWEEQFQSWEGRSLEGKRYVYVWADGVYFNVRLTGERACVLVLIGATGDGRMFTVPANRLV